MYVHRMIFSYSNIDNFISINHKSENDFLTKQEYESIISIIWRTLKINKGENAKKPVLVSYMKTRK